MAAGDSFCLYCLFHPQGVCVCVSMLLTLCLSYVTSEYWPFEVLIQLRQYILCINISETVSLFPVDFFSLSFGSGKILLEGKGWGRLTNERKNTKKAQQPSLKVSKKLITARQDTVNYLFFLRATKVLD